jgi:hypothetical protein
MFIEEGERASARAFGRLSTLNLRPQVWSRSRNKNPNLLESFLEPKPSRVSQGRSQAPPRKVEPHLEDSHGRTEDRRHLAKTQSTTEVQHHCRSLTIREFGQDCNDVQLRSR